MSRHVRGGDAMSSRLWLALYSLVMRALQPLVVRKLKRRSLAEPLYAQHIPERWGQYQTPSGQGYVWLHAVSLGETRVAALLIPQLRAQWPDVRILLTHGTATGRELGQGLLQPGDAQVWQPWDTPQAVQRFLDHFQPRVGLLMETEVWPNWVRVCRDRGMPLVLVNARMSEASSRKAHRLSMLSHPAYAGLREVWAQTQEDAKRLRELGAPVTAVTGNLKFDIQVNERQQSAGLQARAGLSLPVVMLASSREGEEAAFLQALRARPSDLQRARWLVVPRHPQRFDDVIQSAQRQGWNVLRRSEFSSLEELAVTWEGRTEDTLVIGDSLGEMGMYYACSAVTLMGGSFEPMGGQNLIEALAYGSPVVVGPHTFNFAQATEEAVSARVAVRVQSMEQGIEAALEALSHGQSSSDTNARCRQFVIQHAGATRQVMLRLQSLLDPAA
jgi:3-deoxy-D-manno-octulosonic-acid transferase